jgi:predicted nucleotide-binding protein
VFERTELERELQGLRSNVIYRRKESDPSDLIRAIRSFVYIDDPTPGIFHNVFIVHGHDQEAAEVVARFIEKLNFIPIILQEQASLGRTIIEKFEECSNVAFAIVLVTPDDIVVSKDATEGQESRARQNVIFELGFFVAKLGRGRVCILFKKSVEIPSDYKGVVYISMDSKGNWRTELAREMKAVGLPVDLNRII